MDQLRRKLRVIQHLRSEGLWGCGSGLHSLDDKNARIIGRHRIQGRIKMNGRIVS